MPRDQGRTQIDPDIRDLGSQVDRVPKSGDGRIHLTGAQQSNPPTRPNHANRPYRTKNLTLNG